MKKFKYTTSFSSEIKPLISEDKDKYLAMASLVEVGDFIPDVDTEKNVDLLPIAFNACVVNRVNKNGDVVDTPTALAMCDDFINKPINIEHNRDRVVGVILTAGYSEFGTDKPLTKDQVKDLKGPFNITLGGVVWKVVNNRLSDMIENSSDPTSEDYLKISASWELGFSEYNIIKLTDDDKNIENGTIITDASEIDELMPFLRGFGGSGQLEDGSYIYRQVVNNVVPLGIGLTENPAADVAGVATVANIQKSDKNEEKSSQLEEKNVTKSKELFVMDKITDIEQITDESLKAGEVKASVITDFIENRLQEASEKFVDEKQEVENKLKAAEEDHKTLVEDHSKVKEELENISKELEAIKAEQEAKLAEETFNQRMASFDEKYDLNDEHRSILAADIKDMSDEDFDAYAKKMNVLLPKLSEKSEAQVEEKVEEVVASEEDADTAEEETTEEAVAEEVVTEEAVASEAEQVIEEAVENAEVDKAEIPTTTDASSDSLVDKYRAAFSLDNFELK